MTDLKITYISVIMAIEAARGYAWIIGNASQESRDYAVAILDDLEREIRDMARKDGVPLSEPDE